MDWASSLKTDALQEGLLRSGEPDKFNSWRLGDPGPPKEEEGFSDEEFQQLFASSRPAWLEARDKRNVEAMWHLLEGVLCQCHNALREQFQRPALCGRQQCRRGTGTKESFAAISCPRPPAASGAAVAQPIRAAGVGPTTAESQTSAGRRC